mgnify:FL=1
MVKQNGLNIKFLHDCLLIDNILVIGDVHIGYDEQYDGISVLPGMQLKEILEKLNGIFNYLENEKIKIDKIVLLGDVKHDFGKITDIEWRETLEFFNFLKKKLEGSDKINNKTLKYGADKIGSGINKNNFENKIIVVRGNHDNILKPIVKKIGIKLFDYYCVNIKSNKKDKIINKLRLVGRDKGIGNIKINKNKEMKICFLHGNKLFKRCLDNQTDVLIFGHLHPAITLYDKYKAEKYKCFLRGLWKIDSRNKEVYILPNFSSVGFGYDLRNIDNINERGRTGILNWFSKLKSKSKNIKRDKSKLKKTSRNKGRFFVIPNNILKNFEVVVYNNKEKKEYSFGMLNRLLKKHT